MSYQVLARKWRPHRFAEMVGQEHVVRALSNALDNDRLHHAYLFTGTRGVGKTTLARILAKSLNCERGVGSTPCGECAACREVDEGRFADLIEVDAASRTKVDQTRELLDNVPYAPVRGRYKVYLIDEVHMFSDSSFNALLKTLEEPPPHVKFLLATTDPQKVPVTVLSRCLQFNLKRLSPEQISAQLEHILNAEGIDFDASAVQLLALAADGSMRDALSLLDQAIVFGAGEVRDGDARAMLGSVDRGRVRGLLEALADGDGDALLRGVAELADGAPDFADVLRQLLRELHLIALIQTVPDAANARLEAESLRELASRMPAEDVQLYYQIGLIGQRDLPLAPDPRAGLEMVLLRMLAFRPDDDAGQGGAIPSRGRAVQAQRAGPASPVAPAPRADAMPRTTPIGDHVAEPPPDAASEAADAWSTLVARLKLAPMTRELANNCTLLSRDERRVVLGLDPARAGSLTDNTRERLRQALVDHFGAPLELEIRRAEADPAAPTPARRRELDEEARQRNAEQAIMNDPLVREVRQAFDAQPVPGTLRVTPTAPDNP